MKTRKFFQWLLVVLFITFSNFVYCENKIVFNNKIENKQEKIVYITKTGKKYHNGDCGYLRQSKISIGKNEALGKGYTPCSKCKP